MAQSRDPVTWSAMFSAQAAADVPAVAFGAQVWTAGDLAAAAASGCAWLRSLQVPDGVPIPVLLTTSPEALALVVAGASSGWPIAPLNPRLTARELTAIIDGLASPVIVAENASIDIAKEVAGRLGRRVVILPALEPSRDRLDADRPEDSTALLLHTSGTTGLPKPVAISQRKLALRAVRQGAVMGLEPGARYVSFSPLSHIAGLGTVLIGLGLGAMAVPQPRFSPEDWVAAAAHQPTHAQLVPAMIDALMGAGVLGVPSLKVLLYGSSVMRPEALAETMDALPGADMLNMYGQTEGSPLTYLDGDDHRYARAGHPELLLSAGRAVDGVELRIEGADADGEGEICARAEHLFRCDPDGWLRTGDLGVLDARGYLRILGRKGDLIIRGGENVYPVEVENVIVEHPGIAQAAIVGVPDRRLGQVPRAFVVLADAEAPSPDDRELHDFTRERLAGFKVPTSWVVVDELPRTPIGKVRIPAEWRTPDLPAELESHQL